ATLDGDVDTLIRRYQRDPKRHEVAVEPERLVDVNHRFLHVDKIAKVGAAATLVRRHGTGIVFVRTKHGADRVARQLETAGVKAVPLHGDRSQAQRERALQSFRRGDVHALVATDVVARGIHVDDVGVVVHWDPADDHKDYVHRSGRTGRAGAGGEVVSLVTDETRKKTIALQRLLQLPVGIDRINEVPGVPVDVRVHMTPAPTPSPASVAETEADQGRPSAEPARRPRPVRAERAERPMRTERPARAGRFERPERTERPARAEGSERTERTDAPNDRATDGRPVRGKPAWAKADRNDWSPSKPKPKAKSAKPKSKLKAKPGAKAAQGTAKRSTTNHGKPVAAKRTARTTGSTTAGAAPAATAGSKPKRLRKKPVSTGVAR
ncbi:MAG: helicase-related protein, partial [Acidimicrobiia bacterium]